MTGSPSASGFAAASEAAEWFLALQGTQVSAKQLEGFADWLRRSPIHIQEFLQLSSLQGDLLKLHEIQGFDIDAALANCDGRSKSRLVALFSRTPLNEETETSEYRPRRRRMAILAVACGLAATVLVATGLWLLRAEDSFRNEYQTNLAEQLRVTLPDGSYLDLNARSSLSASLSGASRDLHLHDGEALFQVAKSAVPFRVYTSRATIEARGTEFNVNVTEDATVVSLLEGHVLVTTPKSSIVLNSGQQVSIPKNEPDVLSARMVDTKAIVAWTHQRLVFEDAPLSIVTAAFNRYSRKPFIIADPSLREIRITASFDIYGTKSFADSLAAAGNLKVTSSSPKAPYLIERQ